MANRQTGHSTNGEGWAVSGLAAFSLSTV